MLSRVDKGRVALLLSDQMWLWARGYRGRRPASRSAAPSRPLADEGARARRGGFARHARTGATLTIERQSLKGDVPQVDGDRPDRRDSKVAARRAPSPACRARRSRSTNSGSIASATASSQALVNVGPDNPLEFQEVVSTPEKLRPLAEATGGTVRRIAAGEGDEIAMPRIVAMHKSPSYGGADYIGVKRTGSSVIVGVASMPLAVGFLGLGALLGAIVLVWCREGSGGSARRRTWQGSVYPTRI